MNGAAWRRLRPNSTAVVVTTLDERRGISCRLRIRARDKAGNVSAWLTSATLRVH